MSDGVTLDYPRLWRTLLKLGVKNLFSTIRQDFFMTIANDGYNIYKPESLDEIINESRGFNLRPDFIEYVKKAIGPEDSFKHHYCSTMNDEIVIEYFANVTRKLPDEFKEFVYGETTNDIDANCSSGMATDTVKIVNSDGTVDETTETRELSVHLIIIGEILTNGESIKPEIYPGIIKHELTHICLYEVKRRLTSGYYNSIPIPSLWSDEEIEVFHNDVEYLNSVLTSDEPDAKTFVEFVCEFLMYEADGQIKVKNNVVESRVPKLTKSDTKPKITYRNVTPFERFETVVDIYDDSYRETYAPIIESIRPCYVKYDEFLESIRM